jgi:hypothetical protein
LIERYELQAIKNILAKKGITITKEEIKEEHDRLLQEKWYEDEGNRRRKVKC